MPETLEKARAKKSERQLREASHFVVLSSVIGTVPPVYKDDVVPRDRFTSIERLLGIEAIRPADPEESVLSTVKPPPPVLAPQPTELADALERIDALAQEALGIASRLKQIEDAIAEAKKPKP